MKPRWTRKPLQIAISSPGLTLIRANDIAAGQESAKSEPDLSYLIGLRSAISILHLMNTCIRSVLIPLAAANVSIRRDMEKTSNLAMDRMEEKINNIMQRSVDVVITWVSKLLLRQVKTDFRPRDDALGGGAWLEQLQTPVSSLLIQCLETANRHHRHANQSSPS